MTNKRFAKIYVEISNACNLACAFCPSGVSTLQSTSLPPKAGAAQASAKRFMTSAELSHIFEQGRDLTQQFTLHVLGEPTAHPDFANLIQLAEKMKAPLNITTNGILTHVPQIEAALLNPTVQQVNFSLQSWTANFKIEKVQSYLTRILAFIDIAQKARPDLYINLRVWNFGSAEENQLGNVHFLKPLAEKFGQDLLTIKTNVAMKKSHKIEGRLYLHFDSRFEWPDPAQPVRSTSGFCYGLKNHIGILADGTVVPCCLDSNGYINLGDIHKSSLSDILNGPRAKKVYHGFEKNQLVEDLCQKCTYIARFDSKLNLSEAK